MKSLKLQLIGTLVLVLTSSGWALYTDLTSPSGSFVWSSYWNIYVPGEAFDNDLDAADEWESLDDVNTAAQYIGYDFGSGQVINWYRFRTGNDYEWQPSTWEFQGSNSSNFSTKTVVHSISGASFSTGVWTDYYTSSNTAAYQYYRIYVTDVTGGPNGDFVSINEIEMGYDSSLPVFMRQFAAVCVEDGVLLSWKTESEVNNAGFILERQSNANNWQEIASYKTVPELKGQGNTSGATAYEFVDRNVQWGATYRYRLSDVSMNGEVTVDGVLTIEAIQTEMPKVTDLKPVSPNPFNPTTSIHYDLNEETRVTLVVFDLMGRQVQTLVKDQTQVAGSYLQYWNGRDASGRDMPSGTYILHLRTTTFTKSQKMVLMR